MTVKTHFRHINEIDRFGDFDELENGSSYCGFGRDRHAMLVSNPSNVPDSVIQILGSVDGHIMAVCGAFPVRLIADGQVYGASGVGGLSVDQNYRATGYALELYEHMKSLGSDHILIGYGLSQKARKLARLMGSAVFDVARFATIKKSCFFLENYRPQYNKPIFRIVLNIGCALHRVVVHLLAWLKTAHVQMKLVDTGDADAINDYAAMIAADGHRFMEHSPGEHIKWILENDFGAVAAADKRLYRIVCGKDRVGYAITRYSKDGHLGCVIDWQFDAQFDTLEPWILIRLMYKLYPKADAVVLAVAKTEEKMIRVFRRLLIPCPDQVAEVGIAEGSPLERHEGWREAKNWRIRPSMGDGAFY